MTWDMDELFSYETVRLVKVKDYRLGLPHALITLIIVVKIFILDLIAGGGYLAKETSITGTVRLTLQAPGEIYEDGTRSAVPRKPASQLPYCLSSCSDEVECSGDSTRSKVQCPAVYSNAGFVKFPSLEGQGAVFLTSRVDMVEQSLPQQCFFSDGGMRMIQPTSPECYQWQPASNQSWYVSQLEDFLVKIDHSMMAPSLALARPGYGMADGQFLSSKVDNVDGELDSESDTINPCDDWHESTPCPTTGHWGLAVGANDRDDVVTVQTLLRAAGIDSLDSLVQSNGKGAVSRRQNGVVLLLRIHYDNSWATKWGFFPDTDKYRYRYSVIDVPDEGFKADELKEVNSSAGTRKLLKRHGIRIVIKQTGDIGAFSTAAALLTCTTSLGLFAVARVIVDFLLLTAKRFAIHHGVVMEQTDKVHELTFKEAVKSAAAKPMQKVTRRGTGPAALQQTLSPAEQGSGSMYEMQPTSPP